MKRLVRKMGEFGQLRLSGGWVPTGPKHVVVVVVVVVVDDDVVVVVVDDDDVVVVVDDVVVPGRIFWTKNIKKTLRLATFLCL